MAAISLSALRKYCYYLVLSSNIRVKGDRMRRENNPMRLPLERLGAHFLSHNVQLPTEETETLDACIEVHFPGVSSNVSLLELTS